jgi:hypothetical protein
MTSADAEAMIAAFETDTSVRTALQNGIATGLGIDSSMVVVTGVSAQASRRLQAGDESVVQVDYTITVPSGSSTTLSTSSITGPCELCVPRCGARRRRPPCPLSVFPASW